MKLKTEVLKTLALRAKNLELQSKEAAKEIKTRTLQLVENGTSEDGIVKQLHPLVLDLYFHSSQLKDLVEVLKTLEREAKTDEEVKTFIVFLAKETNDTMLNLIKEIELENEKEGV